MVRLDAEGKAFLAQAAELRRISVSDYVRTVTVPQARAEVFAAREQRRLVHRRRGSRRGVHRGLEDLRILGGDHGR